MRFRFSSLSRLLPIPFASLREYERGVVFLLGRFWKVKGPGLVIIVPFIQQMVRMDLRTRVLDVPPQDVISKDNVSVKVNAVVYFRVLDPEKAVIQVEQFEMATSQFAQTTLRSVLGQHDLDQMLAEREKLNTEVQRILDERTDAWGIKVSNVELKHIDLNETMIRAIAKQAEAERLRRAKIIDAEGELQAAERLAQAGEILSKRPEAMQLALPRDPAQYRGRKELDHRLSPCRWIWQARSGSDRRRSDPTGPDPCCDITPPLCASRWQGRRRARDERKRQALQGAANSVYEARFKGILAGNMGKGAGVHTGMRSQHHRRRCSSSVSTKRCRQPPR